MGTGYKSKGYGLNNMSLFSRKKEYPKLRAGGHDIVLRCSICNGEQVICLRDKESGDLREIMLVNSEDDLRGFCKANGISEDEIRKVY